MGGRPDPGSEEQEMGIRAEKERRGKNLGIASLGGKSMYFWKKLNEREEGADSIRKTLYTSTENDNFKGRVGDKGKCLEERLVFPFCKHENRTTPLFWEVINPMRSKDFPAARKFSADKV